MRRDAEMWVFPAVLAFAPSLARSVLDYRIARVEQAYDNAKADGLDGVRESGDNLDLPFRYFNRVWLIALILSYIHDIYFAEVEVPRIPYL